MSHFRFSVQLISWRQFVFCGDFFELTVLSENNFLHYLYSEVFRKLRTLKVTSFWTKLKMECDRDITNAVLTSHYANSRYIMMNTWNYIIDN